MNSRASTLALALAAILTVGTAAPGRAQEDSPVRIGGVAYTQYSVQLSDTAGHGNAFELTRAYVNVLGSFAHGIGTRVTTDIYRNGDGSLGVRLKYGYVTWTPESSPLTFKLGQIHTPWLDWEESLWGYRMQGPMALDRAGYITSSDLGAGVDGAWGGQAVNAQLVVVNGEGYHSPEGDRRKDVAARASVRLLSTDDDSKVGGLRLTAYGHLGTRTGGGARDRAIGMLSYRSSALTLAGELGLTRDGEDGGATVDGRVISGFAVLRLADSPFGVIGRVDRVDPNTDLDDDARTVLIAGVSYQLSPNVRLLADLDHGFYQSDVLDPDVEAHRSRALFQAQFSF